MEQRATGDKGSQGQNPHVYEKLEWAWLAKKHQEIRVQRYKDLKVSLTLDSKSNGEPLKFLQ